MFLESCRHLKKLAFQKHASLGQEGESLKKVPGQRNGAQRGENFLSRLWSKPRAGVWQTSGAASNSWFHLDFCVINRHLPVPWPHVSSKPFTL